MLLLAPPITLLAMAHFAPREAGGLWIGGLILIAVAALVAIRSSRWSLPIQLGVGVVYLLAAVPLLPWLALLAVCTTGDCI